MKRAASEDNAVRKRRCSGSLQSPAPSIGRGWKCPHAQPASVADPSSFSFSNAFLDLTRALDAQTTKGGHFDSEFAAKVIGNHSHGDCFDSSNCAEVHAPRASLPPSIPSSQPHALTEEALEFLQQSLVKQKPKGCLADYNLEAMAAPPTPRSTLSHNRGRTKRPARQYRSRTPSPSKKPSPQTYRTRNMYHSNVAVEHLDELPLTIDSEIRHIFKIKSWEDQVEVPVDGGLLHDAAVSYRAESVQNTRDCALEGEWRASLFQLIKQLLHPVAGKLKAHMSEKIWNSALKPTSLSPFDVNDDDDDSEMRTLSNLEDPVATIWSAPSLPPSTVGTSNTEAADPYYISTPKPDITVGLAHIGFAKHHQWCLIDHQASGTILSDPHAADMGIRFPFLIVEAKGLSQNGSLVSAQNQAAIGGACMLAILQDLHNQANRSTSALDAMTPTQDISPLCFSIVTAGAIHEMYVHFRQDGMLHMHCFRSFRTTLTRDTREFVYFISRILEWGRDKYSSGILENLNQVPMRGAVQG